VGYELIVVILPPSAQTLPPAGREAVAQDLWESPETHENYCGCQATRNSQLTTRNFLNRGCDEHRRMC